MLPKRKKLDWQENPATLRPVKKRDNQNRGGDSNTMSTNVDQSTKSAINGA